jgi:hypothetical protein
MSSPCKYRAASRRRSATASRSVGLL